jgi:Ca2+-binding RTX toxin-like protein
MTSPTTPIRLTSKAETWTGTLQDDVVYGRAGNDTLDGGAGRDTLHGGAGDDMLRGGLGDDRLYGGVGDDQLFGGDGNDRLNGGLGDDKLDGGAGDDLAVFSGARSDYQISRKADGSIEVKDLRTTTDNSGVDTLIDVEHLKFTDGTFATDVLAPKPVGPTAGDDVLTGTVGNDTIDGLAGNDTIDGGAGDDTLTGGAGADKLYGGDGRDTFYADAADTVIDGGAGLDGAVFSEPVTLLANKIANLEILIFGAGDDTIDLSGMQTRGTAGARITVADQPGFGSYSEGGIAVNTGGGNNTVIGSQFGDTIYGQGHIEGGGGNDVLYAVGTSYLSGGDGNDWLVTQVLGGETVTMNGGAGNDVFDFYTSGGARGTPIIEDFTAGDKIKIHVDGGFANVHANATAQGTELSFGTYGGKIILQGVNPADVTADMFLLV